MAYWLIPSASNDVNAHPHKAERLTRYMADHIAMPSNVMFIIHDSSVFSINES